MRTWGRLVLLGVPTALGFREETDGDAYFVGGPGHHQPVEASHCADSTGPGLQLPEVPSYICLGGRGTLDACRKPRKALTPRGGDPSVLDANYPPN